MNRFIYVTLLLLSSMFTAEASEIDKLAAMLQAGDKVKITLEVWDADRNSLLNMDKSKITIEPKIGKNGDKTLTLKDHKNKYEIELSNIEVGNRNVDTKEGSVPTLGFSDGNKIVLFALLSKIINVMTAESSSTLKLCTQREVDGKKIYKQYTVVSYDVDTKKEKVWIHGNLIYGSGSNDERISPILNVLNLLQDFFKTPQK